MAPQTPNPDFSRIFCDFLWEISFFGAVGNEGFPERFLGRVSLKEVHHFVCTERVPRGVPGKGPRKGPPAPERVPGKKIPTSPAQKGSPERVPGRVPRKGSRKGLLAPERVPGKVPLHGRIPGFSRAKSFINYVLISNQ